MRFKRFIGAGCILITGTTTPPENWASDDTSISHAIFIIQDQNDKTKSSKNGTIRHDAHHIDLTFDGHADLLILRDSGANQEFYDAYIYDKENNAYIHNERLSDIPCLDVDVEKKELVGQCFHESACENWKEYYLVSSTGDISLVERKGTYCDPISGQEYAYIDRFRNGKKISSKIWPNK